MKGTLGIKEMVFQIFGASNSPRHVLYSSDDQHFANLTLYISSYLIHLSSSSVLCLGTLLVNVCYVFISARVFKKAYTFKC